MPCPSCGAKVKDDAKLCVKCGADLVAIREEVAREVAEARAARAAQPADKLTARQHLKYLADFKPDKSKVGEMLPHPTGWVLGIGLPVLFVAALIHFAIMPSPAQAEAGSTTIDIKATPEQKTEFQVCLAATRAKADNRCGQITGTAQGLRRVSCQMAKRAAGYTKCSGSAAGRFGSCIKRCGQVARTCSSSCAIVGGQGWMDTAKCLVPCWKARLDACLTTCF